DLSRRIWLFRRAEDRSQLFFSVIGGTAHAQNLFLKPSSTRERARYHCSPITHGIARIRGVKPLIITISRNWTVRPKLSQFWSFVAESICCLLALTLILSG